MVEAVPEARALSVRIKVLADRETARAVGYEKQRDSYNQLAENARREAAWLNEAVEELRKVGK